MDKNECFFPPKAKGRKQKQKSNQFENQTYEVSTEKKIWVRIIQLLLTGHSSNEKFCVMKSTCDFVQYMLRNYIWMPDLKMQCH